MKNFNILVVHWKIRLLGGGSRKTNIDGGLPKKETWKVCRLKGAGGWRERGDGDFKGGDNTMHTMKVK